jgi:maltose alpha-D-glucosyltransferase/alpha-amylase
MPLLEDDHGLYLALMRTLATRIAQLHQALALPSSDPAFEPEPITAHDVRVWREYTLSQMDATLERLAGNVSQLPATTQAEADLLIARRDLLARRIKATTSEAPRGVKIRRHGDFHLGQVLLQRNDFVIIDFEGEPGRPVDERRAKHSPLADVAGMLRSFAYARHTALQRSAPQTPEDSVRWEALLEGWERQTREVFISVYDEIARAGALYSSLEEMAPLLTLFEIEKALYEVRYELGNRPDWVSIPVRSLLAQAS